MQGRLSHSSLSGVLNTKLSELLWAFAVTLLLFQPELQRLIPALSWLDEAATMLLALCAFFASRASRLKLPRFAKSSIACILLFVFVCLIGNVFSGVPGNVVPVAIDAFTCVKFFIAAISGTVVFSKSDHLGSLLVALAKALLVVIAACAALSLVANTGMLYGELRYGLHPYEFVFPHPTYLAVGLAGLIILLSSDSEKNLCWISLASVLMVLTLRGKAMGFAVLALLICFLTKRGKKKLDALQIVFLGLVALVIGWGQIETYFGSEGQARYELLRAGVQVALDNCPIGTGFASFGSAITADSGWYSPLYFQYGISSVWGLSQEYSAFISDSFWPTVLGQSGWIGLIAYCGAFVMLIRSILGNADSKLPILLFAAYLLIMSTSESACFNPSSVYLVICSIVASRQRAVPRETPEVAHV